MTTNPIDHFWRFYYERMLMDHLPDNELGRRFTGECRLAFFAGAVAVQEHFLKAYEELTGKEAETLIPSLSGGSSRHPAAFEALQLEINEWLLNALVPEEGRRQIKPKRIFAELRQ